MDDSIKHIKSVLASAHPAMELTNSFVDTLRHEKPISTSFNFSKNVSSFMQQRLIQGDRRWHMISVCVARAFYLLSADA